MPKFLLEGPKGREIVLTPQQQLTIGRHADNDLPVEDHQASRFHCAIKPAGQDRFMLRDLGSRNGTRLNGQPIEEAHLTNGDQIGVGAVVLVFREEASPFDRRPAERAQATIDKGPNEAEGPSALNTPWALDLRALIERLPPKSSAGDPVTLIDAGGDKSNALAGSSPGAVAVRLLLLAASKSRATDIHIEPKRADVAVRMRIDGQMTAVVEFPNETGALLSNLLRTACRLNQSAKDAILDGSFGAQIQRRRVDYRASFTPSVHGQKLVLRVLDQHNAPTKLADLGLPPYTLKRVQEQCTKDAGMVLTCGPTGSGKTTTLYNALRTIDRDVRNVITIEDPVEHHLDGVTQIPVNEDQGKDFNAILRSVLRQDPDVLLVGEIRDDSTARTAMQAAMTGHLVFSTVHAKDAIGAIFRLLDLGAPPFMIASSMQLIIAQRLVRLLCPDCKQELPLKPGQAKRMGKAATGKTSVYGPVGCPKCLRSGYFGRKAVFEVLECNDELRDVILNEPTLQAMRRTLETSHFVSLEQSGWRLVAEGLTSIEEVERVVQSTG